MRTEGFLALVAASFIAPPAVAAPRIELIPTRGLEILTASARPEAGGLRVSGLVRRDGRGGATAVDAHLDIRAFDRDGPVGATAIAGLPRTASNLRHREAVRYQAVIPALDIATVGRIEVRYHAGAHAQNGGEGAR